MTPTALNLKTISRAPPELYNPISNVVAAGTNCQLIYPTPANVSDSSVATIIGKAGKYPAPMVGQIVEYGIPAIDAPLVAPRLTTPVAGYFKLIQIGLTDSQYPFALSHQNNPFGALPVLAHSVKFLIPAAGAAELICV